MEQMRTANIALDIFSIVLSVIPIVYLFSNKRYRQTLNRHFLGIAVSNVMMIIGDLPDWLLEDADKTYERVIMLSFSSLFYTASAFVLYFFARYITEYLKLSGRALRLCLRAVTFVCAIQIIFAIVSPFTGLGFYADSEGYKRGPLFIISQLVPLFCYLLFTVLVIIYRKRLKRREVIFFLLYIY